MFQGIIEQYGCVIQDEPICIRGQIRNCRKNAGYHTIIEEAIKCLNNHTSINGQIRKTELLTIWRDDSISLSSKILITLWWGHPNYQILSRVYSSENIRALIVNESSILERLKSISETIDFNDVRVKICSLYSDFEKGGVFHLSGVSDAFFTKFFHFWFSSHPLVSDPNFCPVIADQWMKRFVYAEMMEKDDATRNEIFVVNLKASVPIVFCNNKQKRACQAYWEFIYYFNVCCNNLKGEYKNLTPFILEDVLFNKATDIAEIYLRIENGNLFLPPWIAGRYNETRQVSIIFNNIKGESYLFEDSSAQLIGYILSNNYYEKIDPNALSQKLECPICRFLVFLVQLVIEKILVDHPYNEKEISSLKRQTFDNKRNFLIQSNGTENLQSVFALVDTKYRDLIADQKIPFSVSFELTYGCNEMCIHCYNPNSSRKECFAKEIASNEIVYEDYVSILDQLADMGVPCILFTGGDPFMKKDFIRILKYAHSRKFAITIYTNGLSLYNNESLFNDVLSCFPYNIGFSLYSTTEEIHDKITRVKGSCHKTMAIAKKVSENGVGLMIKCPVMQDNMKTYRDVYNYAININGVPEFELNITSSVDGRDSFAVDCLRLTEEQMETILKDPILALSPLRSQSSRVVERSQDMRFCGAGDAMNIQPDGTVSPCVSLHISCGNIKKNRVAEIYHSEEMERIRHLTYGDSDKCGKESYCKYCNRCIGQSYAEKGIAENYSTDNCFIAKIREKVASRQILDA